jgi:hypothetical protein
MFKNQNFYSVISLYYEVHAFLRLRSRTEESKVLLSRLGLSITYILPSRLRFIGNTLYYTDIILKSYFLPPQTSLPLTRCVYVFYIPRMEFVKLKFSVKITIVLYRNLSTPSTTYALSHKIH